MADKTPSAIAPIDLDLACLKEHNNFMAIRQGLPPIGATLTNAHGIMWVVDGHTYAPSVMTLGRTERESDPRDLYPVSIPQNLSQKLQDMLQELHACTPKDFVPLDTVPHLRPDQAMPYSHSVDSVSDPNRILLFFDSARIHEAAFAHELAHVWLELVEGIEDYRVLEDLTDSVRYGQVQRIQSFVLDFRVNDLIRSRGIDTFELENDRVKSLEQLAIASSNGYQPPSRWESVAMAMLLAEVFIESTKVLTRADDIFAILREKLPEEWALAEDLAEIVRAEPRSSGDSARQCIDKALILCFTFAGEHLDLEKDLIERPANVNWRDKWPGWLSELTPQQKCEVGKSMARSGLGGYAKVQLLNSLAGAGVQFSTDGESWTDPVALPFRFPDPTRPHGAGSRIMEINEQNRRRQLEQFERMKNGNPGRRAYATGEARFITQVRMEQMLAGEHPYSYALNNPVTYVDPSGDSPVKGRPVRAWFCQRPVHFGDHDTPLDHWFLSVPGCGTIGYGPQGIISTYGDNSDGLGMDRVRCKPFFITGAQAACLCRLKSILASNQKTPSGQAGQLTNDQRQFCAPWAGNKYDSGKHNCQDFVQMLLTHCGMNAPDTLAQCAATESAYIVQHYKR